MESPRKKLKSTNDQEDVYEEAFSLIKEISEDNDAGKYSNQLFRLKDLFKSLFKNSSSNTSKSSRKKTEQNLNIKFDDIAESQMDLDKFRTFTEAKYYNKPMVLPEESEKIMLDKIYQRLTEKIYDYEFPDILISYVNESLLQDFSSIFLDVIVRQFKLDSRSECLVIRKELDLAGIKLTIIDKKVLSPSHGRSEFAVLYIKYEKDEYGIVINTIAKPRLIMEIKKFDINQGVFQCLMAMKDCYDQNNDGLPVFGIVSTGFSWKFLIYDGNNNVTKVFNSETFGNNVIYGNMDEDKDKWIDGGIKKLIRIIYLFFSIIVKDSELIYTESVVDKDN